MEKLNLKFEDLPFAISEILAKVENIENIINSVTQQQPVTELEPYIYGLKGLADFLHISCVTAQRIKNSGKIPFSQAERTIIFKKEDVLKALSNKYKKNNF